MALASRVAFLVSCGGTGAEGTCADGETVIPNYPSGPPGTFISTESFQVCSSAYVELLSGERADLDAMHARLSEQFPGLPPSLHRTYVVETALAAARLGAGMKVRVESDYDRTVLVTETRVSVPLWDKQPL